MQRLCEILFKCFFYPKRKAEKGEFGAITFFAVGHLLGSSFTLIEQRREYPYNSPPPQPPLVSDRHFAVAMFQTYTNQKWHKGCVYLRTCITTLFSFNLSFFSFYWWRKQTTFSNVNWNVWSKPKFKWGHYFRAKMPLTHGLFFTFYKYNML